MKFFLEHFKKLIWLIRENKAVWFYLLLVVIGFPFLQIYYYQKSIFSAMLLLVIYLFSMLIMLALIYFPTAKISVEEKKIAAYKLSPYLTLFLLLLYQIMVRFIIRNFSFMYRKLVLKIIWVIGLNLLVILYGHIVLKIKFKDLGFGWRHIYIIVPLCLVGTLDVVFKGFKDFSDGVLLVIFHKFIAAFYEEILYRGYLFTTLRRIFKKPVNAIVISGILFGFSHVSVLSNEPILKQILIRIETCFFGMIFSFIYYKTKSLIPSTVYHAVINLL
ncbi:hypothetical protein BBF96_15545 [Anoxybacter fermentans]|uniref:CAAX prenyl protease 2/Lysostaphin resistance protein A-like domain-containing protein n=1 Tax=Anoxybacter fermentans TaxID=1323375 RepID=A0A3Q9HT30_9FIRM|nr:CPBP family intramembrane glutamic endopeptidase [Anoxybacter fermentans]AZR74662.1 hypothetical protein BBF96_15545 [Anoxybacter fermentans]